MFGIEMTEFSNVDRKGGQALPTDPGAIELILPVRDLDEVLANVKKAGAPIVSRAGGPVKIATATGMARAVLVRDPDGYLVRAIEVPASEATLPGLVQPGVSMGVAVKDLEATAKFYHDVLGMDLSGSSTFVHDSAMTDLVGAPANSRVPPHVHAVSGHQARADGILRMEGNDSDAVPPARPRSGRERMGGAGLGPRRDVQEDESVEVPMVTKEPVWFTKTISDIFVSDPNGMNLELFQTVPAPAQKPAAH